MNESEVRPVSDQTDMSDPNAVEGWVSPDVAAALAGERVEMGKTIDESLSDHEE